MTSTMTADPAGGKIGVVIVTYNRSAYLARLLHSLEASKRRPDKVIVIDNASDDDTQAIIAAAAGRFAEGVLVNGLQEKNLGGSGGFRAGVETGLALGCDWLWLMDDDVEALPEGLERLMGYAGRFKCVHGRRINHDGRPFFFQPWFNEWLGVPLPRFGGEFSNGAPVKINAGCFEGMLISADLVGEIGLPDARFFITWDDAIYGWLAARKTDVVLVPDVVLRRARPLREISLSVRHLSEASDMHRYYVMRNRALVRDYFRAAGVYNPLGFALGTGLVFGKEVLRLLAVERRLRGFGALWRGLRDGREPVAPAAAEPSGGQRRGASKP